MTTKHDRILKVYERDVLTLEDNDAHDLYSEILLTILHDDNLDISEDGIVSLSKTAKK